jgi:hypothetical protein
MFQLHPYKPLNISKQSGGYFRVGTGGEHLQIIVVDFVGEIYHLGSGNVLVVDGLEV